MGFQLIKRNSRHIRVLVRVGLALVLIRDSTLTSTG